MGFWEAGLLILGLLMRISGVPLDSREEFENRSLLFYDERNGQLEPSVTGEIFVNVLTIYVSFDSVLIYLHNFLFFFFTAKIPYFLSHFGVFCCRSRNSLG